MANATKLIYMITNGVQNNTLPATLLRSCRTWFLSQGNEVFLDSFSNRTDIF